MEGISGIRYSGEIATAARVHRLNPKLLAAVAAQETGGPGSRSGRNIVGDGGHGHGIFQIDDRYHAFARTAEAMDPAKNADYAATLLSGLLKRFGGDVHAALSAYNAGSPTAAGTRTDWGDGCRLGYADSVLRHYDQLSDSSVLATGPDGAPTSTSPPHDDLQAEVSQTASSVFGLLTLMMQQSTSSATMAQSGSSATSLPAPAWFHSTRDAGADVALAQLICEGGDADPEDAAAGDSPWRGTHSAQ